jgi:hypothetical protein
VVKHDRGFYFAQFNGINLFKLDFSAALQCKTGETRKKGGENWKSIKPLMIPDWSQIKMQSQPSLEKICVRKKPYPWPWDNFFKDPQWEENYGKKPWKCLCVAIRSRFFSLGGNSFCNRARAKLDVVKEIQ